MSGLLIAKRHPVLTEAGDCLWQVATPIAIAAPIATDN
jgi:hypothetical protein